MEINIVTSNEHRASNHPVAIAWDFSRPNEKFSKLEEIKKLDLPVNEFLVINLEIECNILEREIFTSVSNHVIWAQTSRVQNILQFQMDPNISGSDIGFFEAVRADMIEASKTKRQDDYRLKLPLLSMTKFSTSMSIRNLIKMHDYFLHLNKSTESFVMKKIFLKACNSIFAVCYEFGYSKIHMDNYKLAKYLCENYKHSSSDSVNGNFMIVSTIIPMHLRAQLVRHRGLTVTDNLFSLMLDDNIVYEDLEMMVEVQVAGTIQTFQEIASKRSCWIAQYNIWSDFLNKITRLVPEMKLPCSGGACPFSADAMLRYEGKDPNPPCPIHCSLNNLTVTLDTREKMYSMIKADNRESLFWNNFVRATTLES